MVKFEGGEIGANRGADFPGVKNMIKKIIRQIAIVPKEPVTIFPLLFESQETVK